MFQFLLKYRATKSLFEFFVFEGNKLKSRFFGIKNCKISAKNGSERSQEELSEGPPRLLGERRHNKHARDDNSEPELKLTASFYNSASVNWPDQ
jgi:hypothetical protein